MAWGYYLTSEDAGGLRPSSSLQDLRILRARRSPPLAPFLGSVQCTWCPPLGSQDSVRQRGQGAPAEVRATQQRATGPGSLLQRLELRRRKGAAFFLGYGNQYRFLPLE